MSDDIDAELGVVPLKVTLKAGPGFEAPWLVIEAETAEELVAQLAAVQADGVLEAVVAASTAYRRTYKDANVAASESAPSSKGAPSTSKASKRSTSSSASTSDAGSADQNVTAETDADPIKAAIDAAETEADLRKVFPQFKKNGWTDEHTKYASSRAAALKESK